MKIKVMCCDTIKLLQIFLLLILAGSVTTLAVGRPQSGVSADASPGELSAEQKLKQAESAADRLIERFHETLDFKTIYDEYFVTAPELRKLSLVFGEEAKNPAPYDESLTERIFNSTMTYMHLYSESTLIQDKPSPEAEKAQAGLKDCKIDYSNNSDPLANAKMEQCVAEMEQVSALLRKQFTPGIFQSALYRENIKEERLRAERNGHNVPRIEKGNEKFGISPETPVYIIRRESFDYYFIEENGAFRVFYVDILPNFRLF